MRVRVIAVGTRMPEWVISGVRTYQKRLPREWRFEWHELPLGSRGKSQDVTKAVLSEGKAMLAMVGKSDRVVALDVQGKSWDTPQVASQLADWQMMGQGISLLIGGPDGLSADCLKISDQSWSLSPLTLPHPLVRIILVEQLYRAWSLLNSHPYHK